VAWRTTSALSSLKRCLVNSQLTSLSRRAAAHRVALAENLLRVSVQQFVNTVIHDKSSLNGALSAVGPRSAPL
jgi:hypothetical protein